MVMRSSRPILRGSVGSLSVIAACFLVATVGTLAQKGTPDWRAHPTKDFPLAGGNYSNHRYSALDQINTTNVQKLGGAWSLRLEDGLRGGQLGNLDATPIVVDGIMYVTSGLRNVLAIDAKTGAVKWRYRPEPSVVGANKGVVVVDGKVIFGRRDNRLIALDQQTGQIVWETVLTTQRAAYTSAAPVYYDGRIFIGTAGGDVGARGQMGAYDVKTGKPIWTFFTVPGPGEPFGDTWEGDSYKYGGAGVWNHVAVDPALGMIYMGTGNAGPDTYGPVRGGDNLFTASVLALDLKTGAYKWHFQEVRHDIWDYDAASPPVLADITYKGQRRQILMHPGKTGWLYILDRTNGKPLIGIEDKPVPQEKRMKTARTQPYPIGDRFVPLCAEPLKDYERGCLFSSFWDTRVVIFPGSSGGNAWAPMTFSPKTNLAYIPANVMSTVYIAKHEEYDEATGRFKTTGGGEGFYRPEGARRSGTLTAMDPTTNKIVWQKQTRWPLGSGGGLLSTAGGLLFHGEPDGHIVARDIRNGDELCMFQTGAGANAPASTFEVDGEQYVAMMSGGNRLLLSQPGDYLWAFKLGGTVPPAPPPRVPPLIHPDQGQERREPPKPRP
jgi:PQQ-dependent dehydrogenase (methanol/ethanol family)